MKSLGPHVAFLYAVGRCCCFLSFISVCCLRGEVAARMRTFPRVHLSSRVPPTERFARQMSRHFTERQRCFTDAKSRFIGSSTSFARGFMQFPLRHEISSLTSIHPLPTFRPRTQNTILSLFIRHSDARVISRLCHGSESSLRHPTESGSLSLVRQFVSSYCRLPGMVAVATPGFPDSSSESLELPLQAFRGYRLCRPEFLGE
uniref:Uncharacterized protein n=1 Tax=Candidatus Kentrum sp. LFY TaxID=2126342 RepID=A0A450UNS7_9GAMM|nr:MAG: hypothetical protein BECKLFY1418A_GA0070994_10383 [Candidatus Kentron sp. LFY]